MERHLIKRFPSAFDDGAIEPGAASKLRRGELYAGLAAFRATTCSGPFDSAAESAWFHAILEREPALASLLELQRPLPTLAVTGTKGVYEGRVDFCIDVPAQDGPRLVIELDPFHHKVLLQPEVDASRDQLLASSGFRTLRITGADPKSDKIQGVARKRFVEATRRYIEGGFSEPESTAAALLNTAFAATRIQVVLLEAISRGLVPVWRAGAHAVAFREHETSIGEVALADLVELLDAIAEVRGISLPGRLMQIEDAITVSDVHPSLTLDVSVERGPGMSLMREALAANYVVIRSVVRSSAVRAAIYATRREVRYPDHAASDAALTYLLRYLFRKEDFREQQLDIIRAALGGRDVIGLLPTGAGKSLTYQIAAMLTPGLTLVVDPLKALMDDQVDGLESVGIDVATAIHSGISDRDEREALGALAHGELVFLFVSPERLQIRQFRDELGAAVGRSTLPYVVVDEAHCVSEWGHAFRTAYLALGRRARSLAPAGQRQPTLVALTGTASFAVLHDIRTDLQLGDGSVEVRPREFTRRELAIRVVRVPSKNKLLQLAEFLAALPTKLDLLGGELGKQSGVLVFCPHVSGDYGVQYVRDALQRDASRPPWLAPTAINFYSGKKPDGWPGNDSAYESLKREVHLGFKTGKIQCLVATNAFGMGIDKPDIRATVHYGIPGSLEALYQEVGRAGRDRKPAICLVIFSDEYDDASRRFFQSESGATASRLYDGTFRMDDVGRLAYFHKENFGAPDADRAAARNLFALVRGQPRGTSVTVRNGTQLFERAAQRLVRLGAVSDYVKEYRANALELWVGDSSPTGMLSALATHLSRHLLRQGVDARVAAIAADPDPAMAAVAALVDFTYATVEGQRRTAIATIVRECASWKDEEQFRQVISNYMGAGPYPEHVAAVEQELAPWKVVKLLGDLTPIAGNALYGAVRRRLESFPERPALWWLSALTQGFRGGSAARTAVLADLVEAVRQTRHMAPEHLNAWIAGAATIMRQTMPEDVDAVFSELVRHFPDDVHVARAIMRARAHVGIATTRVAGAVLLKPLLPRFNDLLRHHGS